MSHTHERLDAQMWNEKAEGGGAVEVLRRRRWRNYRTRWRRQRRGAAEQGRGMCEEEMQIKRGGYLKGIRCKSRDKNISQRWWHRLELRGVKALPCGRRGKKKKVLTSKWAARTENNKSVWVETHSGKGAAFWLFPSPHNGISFLFSPPPEPLRPGQMSTYFTWWDFTRLRSPPVLLLPSLVWFQLW